MEFSSKGPVKSATLEAVIIRADGTREDLGVIARYERNPLRRAYFVVRNFFGGTK
jgi:hypothetical protein